MFNSYVLDQHGKEGDLKRDYLSFRIELAEALIGSFTTRVRSAGRPRSTIVEEEIRLDNTKLHLPVVTGPKRDCLVCCKVREARGLSRSELRHESRIQCSVYDVHLCVTASRNCF